MADERSKINPVPMRWPSNGESMGEYATYMLDLLVQRNMAVTTATHLGGVEENERLRAQLEDARVRLDERRVMLDEREATIRRLTAPSVITARADVDLVERLQTKYGFKHSDDDSACMEPAWCQREHVRTPVAADEIQDGGS